MSRLEQDAHYNRVQDPAVHPIIKPSTRTRRAVCTSTSVQTVCHTSAPARLFRYSTQWPPTATGPSFWGVHRQVNTFADNDVRLCSKYRQFCCYIDFIAIIYIFLSIVAGFVCPPSSVSLTGTDKSLHADVLDCSHYYQCSGDIAFWLQCPSGFYFNWMTLSCSSFDVFACIPGDTCTSIHHTYTRRLKTHQQIETFDT